VIRLAIWVLVVVAAIVALGVFFDAPTARDPRRPIHAPETGRYANCEQATMTGGPGPHRTGTAGYDPYLDRNTNGISCEETDR
jgi:hypothetical protein